MAMEQARLAMTSTNPGHMLDAQSGSAIETVQSGDPWEVTSSGNNVSLEQQLINSGDTNRAYRLNTSVAKAFHSMLMASAKV
jgi:flagellar basal-body rod protein FlgB